MKKSSLITAEYVNTIIKRRKRDIHKGDCGKILLIAGSLGMAGAAILCGKGSLRAGSGLVNLAVPEELYQTIQIGIPEAICVSRESLDYGNLGKYDAIAIGPGIGEETRNEEMIKKIVDIYEGPLILDADGLNIVSTAKLHGMLKKRNSPTILTPHLGEASRLLDVKASDIKKENRQAAAQEIAACTNSVTVLKGDGTIVATEYGETYTNTTGNPGMATGGSGDVLTGIITSFLGQKIKHADAAKAGVYVHGLAGDLAESDVGEYGLMAGDISMYTAYAIKKLLG